MDADTLEREWKIITDLLPPDWRELATSTGALRRARNVRDPGTLLLLVLLHAGAGLSLRQAAARARRTGLAEISDVGLLKRLRNAAPWLHALAASLFTHSPFRRPLPGISRPIRVVDASTVSEPGSTGTNWRIHYVLRLPSLTCDFFEVTDPSGGETYKRVPIQPGDLILGDRGYCHRKGVAHVLDAGGDVIVRLNGSSFPVLDAEGSPLNLLTVLRTLVEYTPGEWPVAFETKKKKHKKKYAARLCAIRKSAMAAQKAKMQLLREASKKQRQLRPETLELAEYIFVLTTLPLTTSTAEVLEF